MMGKCVKNVQKLWSGLRRTCFFVSAKFVGIPLVYSSMVQLHLEYIGMQPHFQTNDNFYFYHQGPNRYKPS